MRLRVLQARSKGEALKLLQEDWVKRTGATLRENLGGREGTFIVVKADDETVKKFLDTGVLIVPENEDELIKEIQEEEERSTAGVGFLGF